MKAIVFSPLLAIFLFVLGANNIFACSCDLSIGDKSLEKQIKQSYKKSTAVFVGEVTEIIKVPNLYSVTVKFKTEQIYKNSLSKEVNISTGRGGGDCGFIFEIGKSYLVYAYGEANNLETNICQRTSLIEETKDIKFLDKTKNRRKIKSSQK